MGNFLFRFFNILTLALNSPSTGNYVIDDSAGLGRQFDGIGGISGGGATSKLLVSYHDDIQAQIYDYLFKPQFGASLQILKGHFQDYLRGTAESNAVPITTFHTLRGRGGLVNPVEIGGDAYSGCGSEASHMRESWDERYDRGYEWHIMLQAKKRNPDIKLYGLPWAYPGWVGDGSGSPYKYPDKTAHYITRWILGAKLHYNLTIDYIGIWNERPYDTTYIKTLRKTLDKNNLQHVKIVAADGEWGIEFDMLKDAELNSAVDIIGVHYPGTKSTQQATNMGKALWASEDYSTFNDNTGAGCWARILNQNYVNGFLTSTISWNVIAAYYEDLPFGRDGLMTAIEPWGGRYVVESPIWVSAHTTQFTEIGWHYLKHGSGVGKLNKGGSFVSLMGKDATQFTMIIETMSHDHSPCIRPYLPPYNISYQKVVFTLKGSLSSITHLNVWYTKLGFNGDRSVLFERQGAIKVENGSISLDLGVDELYTLSTMSGNRGQHDPPPDTAPFPLPYKDFYDGYSEHQEASYFTPQVGQWEVVDSGDSYHKMVNRQVVLHQPIDWCPNSIPISVGGNYNWSDVFLTLDFMVPSVNGSDGVFLAGRVQSRECDFDKTEGVYFFIYMNGTYALKMSMVAIEVVVSGKSPVDLKQDTWYSIGFMMRGKGSFANRQTFAGYIENKVLFMRDIPNAPKHGFIAYGTNKFGIVNFDNLSVEDDTIVIKNKD